MSFAIEGVICRLQVDWLGLGYNLQEFTLTAYKSGAGGVSADYIQGFPFFDIGFLVPLRNEFRNS